MQKNAYIKNLLFSSQKSCYLRCCGATPGLNMVGTELQREGATPLARREPRAQVGTASQVLCQQPGHGAGLLVAFLRAQPGFCVQHRAEQWGGRAAAPCRRAGRWRAATCSRSGAGRCMSTRPALKHGWLKTQFATSLCAGWCGAQQAHPALDPAPASTGWNFPTEIAVD